MPFINEIGTFIKHGSIWRLELYGGIYVGNANQLWAKIIGVVLILVGILGFFNNPILGLFPVNALHNVVHLLTGALFAYAGWKSGGYAQNYNKWLGVVYVLVAVVGFIGLLKFLAVMPGVSDLDNWLHLVIGLVSVGVGWGAK
jgi:hypothetical protein